MESLHNTAAKFSQFNNTRKEVRVVDPNFGAARLPSAFTHWTYAASGKRMMITNV